MPATKDLTILQGKTFNLVLRWETTPVIYKAISGISQTAPVTITCPSHGLVEGWRAAVSAVKGMTEINAEANAVKDKDYHSVTAVDANTIQFNDVNAASFKAYVSGGYVQYNTPVDMVGFSARMSIKDKVGGTELFSLTTANTRIAIDNAAKTIALNITAADTEDILTWTKGVYDLEMVSPADVVTQILSGKVVVTREVTT
jgi:hypothetical protein